MKPHSPTSQKILRQYFKIISQAAKTWKAINRSQLYQHIREFYRSRLISYREEKDGTINITLTEKGRKKALRYKMEELQKSVFIHPYECEDEINFIVEVFDSRPYVRYITATKITNEEELKLRFELV